MADVHATLSSTGLNPDELRAWSIFQPYTTRRLAELIESGNSLVHYTSAEVAVKIITSKTVWMRCASEMNDFSEIDHGVELLRNVFNSDRGKRFQALLDQLHQDCWLETTQQVDQFLRTARMETYLTCLSEHDPRSREHDFGRLSMWRAYGGTSGVALVLNPAPFTNYNSKMAAWSAAVAYFDQDDMNAEFDAINDGIEQNLEYLSQMSREQLREAIYSLLVTRAVATKHPGFREEAEWRVIYNPSHHEPNPIVCEMENVRGIPQPVCKFPLLHEPESGYVGVDVPTLLQLALIGPSSHSEAIASALSQALSTSGVELPWDRIKGSDIPLRTIT